MRHGRPHLLALLAGLLVGLPAHAGVFDDLLGGAPGAAPEAFLPPDQAFGLEVEPTEDGLKARFRVSPGYYLYKDRLAVTPRPGSAAIGVPAIPSGKSKEDPEFGVIEAMTQDFDIHVPVPAAGDDPVRVIVAYQGCAEAGLCYPPIRREFEFLPSAFGGGAAKATGPRAAAGAPGRTAPQPAASGTRPGAADEDQDEAGALAQGLATASVVSTLLLFLGFGLLLAFTPCVFPMVPILSGILVGQGEALTARRGFMVSLAYVLSMAGTYAIAGVVTAMLGANVQAALQHPAVLVAFSGVFVLLAFSMFGFYEIQLPSSLQTRLSTVGGEPGKGGIAGAAVMGTLSALIVGPCVAPPLLGALLYIAATGDAVLGGAALFALGIGMGLPLLVLGASAGQLLPRAGAWMVGVKHVFGVVMLAVAWWLLERLLPGPVVLAGWALLLIGVAAQLGALEGGDRSDGAGLRLRRGLGLAALVYGVTLMLGAAGGADDPLEPLAGFVRGEGGVVTTQAAAFRSVTTPEQVRAELASAQAAGQPVVLDFHADWCIECKRMERTTFRDPQVLAALEGYRLVRVDVTANDEAQRELLAGHGLYGPPATLFFDGAGREVRRLRLTGYADSDAFLAQLAQVRTPGLADHATAPGTPLASSPR